MFSFFGSVISKESWEGEHPIPVKDKETKLQNKNFIGKEKTICKP